MAAFRCLAPGTTRQAERADSDPQIVKQLSMKPQFLFVGPTKSGTTWIDAYLRERADVALPLATKETFFFDKAYDKGIDWYLALFDQESAQPACVEVAPSLFHKPEAAARAASDLPGAQIICTVRDPLDRMVSHYFHYRKFGEPRRTLAEMVEAKPDLINPGLYERNALVWESHFGAGNVHFLFYEDMARDPAAFCRQLCELMGLPYIAPSAELLGSPVNEASVPRSRFLARIVRKLVDKLRLAGANNLVNALKSDRLKSLVFAGGAGMGAERAEIRAEAGTLLPRFEADLAAFEARVGRSVRRR